MNTAAATAAQAGHEPPINFVEQMANLQAVAHGLIHLWHSSTPSTPHAVSRARRAVPYGAPSRMSPQMLSQRSANIRRERDPDHENKPSHQPRRTPSRTSEPDSLTGGCRPPYHREDANSDSAEDRQCEGDLCPRGHRVIVLPSLA